MQKWNMVQGYSFEDESGEELLHISCDGEITYDHYKVSREFLAECVRSVLQNREDTIDLLHDQLNSLR